MNRRKLLSAAASVLSAAVAPAFGQTAEIARTRRLIVPTPPGGASDTCARLLAQALSRSLGQNFVIENKPGAGGALAAQALMAAPPDGLTLMWTLSSMSGLPVLQKASPYQSVGELTPVSLVGSFAYALFVHPDLPTRTVAEFVAYARAQPDRMSYGTGSLGDLMATAKFLKVTGIRSVRVPYRGGSQLLPDLLTGRVQFNFGPLSNGLQQARDGKLRLLAVLTPQRSTLSSETPTMAESGYADITLPSWQALFLPPKTPPNVAERLSRAVVETLQDPALRAALAQQAMFVEGTTPQVLASAAGRDEMAWRQFVTEHAIAPE